MSDVITITDLEETKKHNTFHVDVITGRTGDYATNAVTGQVQKTLPATVNGLDWTPVGNLTTDNCTFTKPTDYAVDDNGTQWIYTGNYPFTATAGTVPSEPTYQAAHVKDARLLSNMSDAEVLADGSTTPRRLGARFAETAIQFLTLDDAINADWLAVNTVVNIRERALGTGEGALWDVDLTSSVTPDGDRVVQSIANPELSLVIRSDYANIKESTKKTATVGDSGDFTTISDALKHYERLGFASSVQYPAVKLLLLSGFVMREQIFITNGESLAHIWIRSEDSEVVIDRSAITKQPTVEIYKPIFYGSLGSTLPVIDCLFVYDDSGTPDGQSGVWVEAGSTVIFGGSGAGVKGSDGRGLHVSNVSTCYARSTIWDNSGIGARVSNNSNCQLRDSSLNDCVFGMACEGSTVGITDTEVKRSTGGPNVTLTACKTIAIRADISDCATTAGALIIGGSFHASASVITGNANDGIRFTEGAIGCLDNATVTGNGVDGIEVDHSTVSARGANLTNNGKQACNVTGGGVARLRGANVTGSSGVFATRAATIDCTDVVGVGTTATVTRGATIAADGYTGSLSQKANTPTANGIIYQ